MTCVRRYKHCAWVAVGLLVGGRTARGDAQESRPATKYTVFTARPSSQPERSRVSIKVHDVPIADALRQVAENAGMALGWSREKIPLEGKVSVDLHNVSVWDALATILHGSGVEGRLSPDGQTILLVRRNSSKETSQVRAAGVVAGRVTDSASGKGIGGAIVLVKGTALRTTTADNGQFTLKAVPAGERTLTVRAFGYKPQSLTVTVTDSERTTVSMALVPTPTVLSKVITEVSGKQQSKEVGSDITVLHADSIMQVAPVATVTDLLETRVPGLTVLRESGIPGAPRRIRLRGTSSIERSNDPIFIVDGIRVNADQSQSGKTGIGYVGPSPIDQLDPNSIETIEVFKGPSASAMYGADAGNGVIVITTKHGKAGRTRWSLSADVGRSSLPSGGYPLNVFRFGHGKETTFKPPISAICFITNDQCVESDSLVRYQALNDPRFNVFSHAPTRHASLTVSGGTGQLTYSLTGSASHESGLFQLPAIEADRFLQQHGFPAPGWMRHPDQYSTWGGSSTLDLPLTGDGGKISLLQQYF